MGDDSGGSSERAPAAEGGVHAAAGAPVDDERHPGGDERRGTGALAVAKSVGAAMIGVQSRRNRERDFSEGKPMHFIVGGLIGTLLFMIAIWSLVQYLIATA